MQVATTQQVNTGVFTNTADKRIREAAADPGWAM